MNIFKNIKGKLKDNIMEAAVLIRCIPSLVVTLFVVSVICMNLLANKTIFQNEWIAIDGGFLISWLSFLCMDAITVYFGPRASNKIAILATTVNLLTCIIFFIASIIPSNAGVDYTELDNILGGTWFILLGSTIAFLSSAFINNFINWSIGKALKDNFNKKLVFSLQCHCSTFIAQFFDNLIFSLIVFVGFAPIFWDGFHWTVLQCITCALTGAVLEVVLQAIFSPISYKILSHWEKHSVGKEYLDRYGK